jgi:DNA-binding XRE family transcriptional regulator
MEKKKFNKLVKSIKQAGKIKRGEPLEDDSPYKPVAHDHEAFLKKALKRKEFRKSYEDLGEEYRLAREMLTARSRIGLTQEEVADLMGTTKSAVSRLEATGKHAPSLTTLKRYAQAVGCSLEIKLVPKVRPDKKPIGLGKKQATG